jgi:hypothetical protein
MQGVSWLLAGILTLITVAWAALQDDAPAVPLALALVRAMNDRGLDYFAAKDPQSRGRYVGVSRLGTGQLSLVTDHVDVPLAMDERLAHSDYEGVYWSLTTATSRKERFFVHDLGGLGLRPARKPGHAFDMVDQSGTHLSLDGDWLSQRMSSDDYHRVFKQAERLYVHALQVLIARLEAVATAPHTQSSALSVDRRVRRASGSREDGACQRRGCMSERLEEYALLDDARRPPSCRGPDRSTG